MYGITEKAAFTARPEISEETLNAINRAGTRMAAEHAGPNQLMAQAANRQGETPYYNNWMNFAHVEYWLNSPGDTGIKGETVSDYLTQMLNRLKYPNGSGFLEQGSPFNGFRAETWNVVRAQNTSDSVDWGIERYAGLTMTKISKINSVYCKGGGVYSHEFGHNYHQTCDVDDNCRTRIGQILKAEYNRLRGADITARTPFFERFAEDFKYFFGADDVALIPNPDDDANHPTDPNVGRQVRWAADVQGLSEFIRGMWPVYNWLKDKDVPNFGYIESGSWFKWERKTSWVTSQWEALAGGVFYRWDGNKWVVYN